MHEQSPPAIGIYIPAESSILEDPYQKEIQNDIWLHERKKTMQAVFAIGITLLISNVVGFASADALVVENLIHIFLVPVIFMGLGLFAQLQPMIAAIGGILVILAITIINYMVLGSLSLMAGWLYKAIALYFLIKSVRHAREAETARKNLADLPPV